MKVCGNGKQQKVVFAAINNLREIDRCAKVLADLTNRCTSFCLHLNHPTILDWFQNFADEAAAGSGGEKGEGILPVVGFLRALSIVNSTDFS